METFILKMSPWIQKMDGEALGKLQFLGSLTGFGRGREHGRGFGGSGRGLEDERVDVDIIGRYGSGICETMGPLRRSLVMLRCVLLSHSSERQ